jgi:hypothetical protein
VEKTTMMQKVHHSHDLPSSVTAVTTNMSRMFIRVTA